MKVNFMAGIQDKAVAITGASSGIGGATAIMLVNAAQRSYLARADWIGWRLSLVASRQRVARSPMPNRREMARGPDESRQPGA